MERTKKLMVLAVLFLMGSQLFAQNDQTLFNRGHRAGFFITPMFEQGPLNEPWRTSAGGGFGFIVGDAFIGGYGLVGLDYDQLFFNDDLERIDLAHGGLWLGYSPFQHKVVHPTVGMKVGWGATHIDVDEFHDDFIDDDEQWILDNKHDLVDAVFVLSPDLGLEVNLTRWLRVNASAGYRWTNDVDTPGLSDNDFSGWTGTLMIKIGWFGRGYAPRTND